MSIITLENKQFSIDSSNFIYSKCSSRPSKSVVNPENYTKYKSIKETFSFLDGSQDLSFKECIGYIFGAKIKIDKTIYILDNETYKVVNFTDNKFKILTKNLNDKHLNYIIIVNDIYTYPKIQYIYMLSNFFTNVKIVTSQLMSYKLIVCHKRITNLDFEIKDNYIKDFDIKVDELLVKYIKDDNDTFLENTINMNHVVNSMCNSLSQISNLNRETYTINKYYKAFINKECNTYSNCNCKINSIFYSNLFECYICENCLILTRIFP